MKNISLSSPNNSCGAKAKIDYPCLWQYKVIGEDREAMIGAIKKSVGNDAHVVTDSNVSSSGRYLSLNMETVVLDEEHRLRIHRTLADHQAVKVVL